MSGMCWWVKRPCLAYEHSLQWTDTSLPMSPVVHVGVISSQPLNARDPALLGSLMGA